MKKKDDPLQVLFGFAEPTMQSLGDGRFVITPGKPVVEMTPAQAAKRLGLHRRVIYRLIDEGILVARRPARRKFFVTAASVEAHYTATKDLEFWEKRSKKAEQAKK